MKARSKYPWDEMVDDKYTWLIPEHKSPDRPEPKEDKFTLPEGDEAEAAIVGTVPGFLSATVLGVLYFVVLWLLNL